MTAPMVIGIGVAEMALDGEIASDLLCPFAHDAGMRYTAVKGDSSRSRLLADQLRFYLDQNLPTRFP